LSMVIKYVLDVLGWEKGMEVGFLG
jgi:hypothetical protein